MSKIKGMNPLSLNNTSPNSNGTGSNNSGSNNSRSNSANSNNEGSNNKGSNSNSSVFRVKSSISNGSRSNKGSNTSASNNQGSNRSASNNSNAELTPDTLTPETPETFAPKPLISEVQPFNLENDTLPLLPSSGSERSKNGSQSRSNNEYVTNTSGSGTSENETSENETSESGTSESGTSGSGTSGSETSEVNTISPNSLEKISFANKKPTKTRKILPRGRQLYLNKASPNNSTKPILEQLFNAVHYKAYILQKYDTFMKRRKKAHPFFDMNYLWNPIHLLLSSGVVYKAKSWSLEVDENTKKEILELNEVTDQVINNRNHSLVQQIKIPLNEPPTVPNIIKVALYAGIYQGFTEGDGKKFNTEYPITSIYQVIQKSDVDRISIRLNSELLNKVKQYLDIYPTPRKNFTFAKRR